MTEIFKRVSCQVTIADFRLENPPADRTQLENQVRQSPANGRMAFVVAENMKQVNYAKFRRTAYIERGIRTVVYA